MQTNDVDCLIEPALLLLSLSSHCGTVLELVRVEPGAQKAVGSLRLLKRRTLTKQKSLESLGDRKLRLHCPCLCLPTVHSVDNPAIYKPFHQPEKKNSDDQPEKSLTESFGTALSLVRAATQLAEQQREPQE